jgi:putative flippase GtrA
MASLGGRSLAFNLVGLAGALVQLTTLAALLAGGLGPVPAAALAVEAAVLHNFVWHQRWTWRDRPARSRRELASRLARFHLLNGAISLAGNVALMVILTGRLRLHPLVANLIAIVACSLVNFAASETLVFPASVPADDGVLQRQPGRRAPRGRRSIGISCEVRGGSRNG